MSIIKILLGRAAAARAFAFLACIALSACANPVSKPFEFPSLIDDHSMDEIAADHDFPAWSTARDRIASLAAADQLQAVNDFVNAMPVDWRRTTHWASPRQLADSGGLCKDYALAKHEMLAELGWPRADMRVVALRIEGSQFSGHAVLLVRHQGHVSVLDNMTAPVLADHYFMPKTEFVGQMISLGGNVGIYQQPSPNGYLIAITADPH